jgi:hypothetical protein
MTTHRQLQRALQLAELKFAADEPAQPAARRRLEVTVQWSGA